MRKHLLPLTGLTASSPVFDQLNAENAWLVSQQARGELISRIQRHSDTCSSFTVATRLGWHDGTFVLPECIFGPEKDSLRVCLDRSRPEQFSRYRVGGSFEGWQEIAKLAVGNSRLVLLIAAAFSGPVAALLGLEQIGLMLVGSAEAGKTTALIAAGSVWGCHADSNMARQGFGQPFNATDNDLEDELLAANHTLLVVDETRAAGVGESEIGKMLIRVIMRWETGFEKGRKNAGKGRQAASVPFILSSNLSLGRLGALAKNTVDDAHHGRLISIPLPDGGYGVFENLHGERGVVAISGRLRKLATTNFGHAAYKFLEALTEANARDSEGLRTWFAKRRSYYLRGARYPGRAPGRHMKRIDEKMATVYAAACFAIKHGILPWDPKTVDESLRACVRGHVALVATEASAIDMSTRSQHVAKPPIESERLIEQLRQYVKQNEASFINRDAPGAADLISQDGSDCPVIKHRHARNGLEYLFTDRQLLSIYGKKSHTDALKSALDAVVLIATESGADGIPRYSVKRSIPGNGRMQYIAIRAAAFECDQ